MKTIKKLLVLILITSLSACGLIGDDDDIAGNKTIHFKLLSSSSHSFVDVVANGISKKAHKTGDNIDPCDGGDYAGFASFDVVLSSVSYIIYDINGRQVGSGSATVNSNCKLVRIE